MGRENRDDCVRLITATVKTPCRWHAYPTLFCLQGKEVLLMMDVRGYAHPQLPDGEFNSLIFTLDDLENIRVETPTTQIIGEDD